MNTEKYEAYSVPKNTRIGNFLAGIVVIVVGITLLNKQQQWIELPYWVYTWKMLLVAIGVFSAFKKMFRSSFWLVWVIVGGLFLLEDIFPAISIKDYIWPIIIIIAGLFLMFSSPKKCHANYKASWWHNKKKEWKHTEDYELNYNKEDYLDSVSMFGGIKKKVISKDFKGGEITNIFGGAEIDLSQADIQGKISLEITQVFGGTRLVVPSHWVVQSELVALLGAIEDRSQNKNIHTDPNKVLLLRGNTVFGGIDIRNF